DLDYFKFNATQGSYYEILVTKPGGSNAAFVPAIFFIDPSGNVTFANPNKAASQTVRLEAYAFETGTHYVRVGDTRNTSSSTAFGGADYTYTMQLNAATRTVTALSGFPIRAAAAGTANPVNTVINRIDQGGKTAWYTFTIPSGPAKLAWIDLDLRTLTPPDGGTAA